MEMEFSSPDMERLHRLAVDCSSTLLRLHSGAESTIENEVARVLRALGEELNADRTAWLELQGDIVARVRTWCRPGRWLSKDEAAANQVSWAVSVLATGLVGLAAISGEALAQRVPASSLVAARAAGQVAGRLGGRDDRVSVVLADVVWCRAGFAVPAWRRIP